MAVVSKEELLTLLNEVIGDNTNDSTITLIENLSDTFDSMSNADYEELKEKYEGALAEAERIESKWRDRYKKRFFGDKDEIKVTSEEVKEDNGEEEKEITFEDLFEEEK